MERTERFYKIDQPGDLVITADIPLAAEVIAKGGHALNPRGEFYATETIQERFADQLDRFLTRQAKG